MDHFVETIYHYVSSAIPPAPGLSLDSASPPPADGLKSFSHPEGAPYYLELGYLDHLL